MALLVSACKFRKMGTAYSTMFLFSCDFADKIITPKGYGTTQYSDSSDVHQLFFSPVPAFRIIC